MPSPTFAGPELRGVVLLLLVFVAVQQPVSCLAPADGWEPPVLPAALGFPAGASHPGSLPDALAIAVGALREPPASVDLNGPASWPSLTPDCTAAYLNSSVASSTEPALWVYIHVPAGTAASLSGCTATGLRHVHLGIRLGRASALALVGWDVEVGGVTVTALAGGIAPLHEALVVVRGRSRIDVAPSYNRQLFSGYGPAAGGQDVHALNVVGPASVAGFGLAVIEGSSVEARLESVAVLYAGACVIRASNPDVAFTVARARITVGGAGSRVVARAESTDAYAMQRARRAYAVTIQVLQGVNVAGSLLVFGALDGAAVDVHGEHANAAVGLSVAGLERGSDVGCSSGSVSVNDSLFVAARAAVVTVTSRGHGSGTVVLGAVSVARRRASSSLAITRTTFLVDGPSTAVQLRVVLHGGLSAAVMGVASYAWAYATTNTTVTDSRWVTRGSNTTVSGRLDGAGATGTGFTVGGLAVIAADSFARVDGSIRRTVFEVIGPGSTLSLHTPGNGKSASTLGVAVQAVGLSGAFVALDRVVFRSGPGADVELRASKGNGATAQGLAVFAQSGGHVAVTAFELSFDALRSSVRLDVRSNGDSASGLGLAAYSASGADCDVVLTQSRFTAIGNGTLVLARATGGGGFALAAHGIAAFAADSSSGVTVRVARSLLLLEGPNATVAASVLSDGQAATALGIVAITHDFAQADLRFDAVTVRATAAAGANVSASAGRSGGSVASLGIAASAFSSGKTSIIANRFEIGLLAGGERGVGKCAESGAWSAAAARTNSTVTTVAREGAGDSVSALGVTARGRDAATCTVVLANALVYAVGPRFVIQAFSGRQSNGMAVVGVANCADQQAIANITVVNTRLYVADATNTSTVAVASMSTLVSTGTSALGAHSFGGAAAPLAAVNSTMERCGVVPVAGGRLPDGVRLFPTDADSGLRFVDHGNPLHCPAILMEDLPVANPTSLPCGVAASETRTVGSRTASKRRSRTRDPSSSSSSSTSSTPYVAADEATGVGTRHPSITHARGPSRDQQQSATVSPSQAPLPLSHPTLTSSVSATRSDLDVVSLASGDVDAGVRAPTRSTAAAVTAGASVVLVAVGAGFIIPGVGASGAGGASRLAAASRLAVCGGEAPDEPDYVTLPVPLSTAFASTGACSSPTGGEDGVQVCGLGVRAFIGAVISTGLFVSLGLTYLRIGGKREAPAPPPSSAAAVPGVLTNVSVAAVTLGLTYVGPGAVEAALMAATSPVGGVPPAGTALAIGAAVGTTAAVAATVWALYGVTVDAGALGALLVQQERGAGMLERSNSGDRTGPAFFSRLYLASRVIIVEGALTLVVSAAAGANGRGPGSVACFLRAAVALAASLLFAAFVIVWKPLAGPRAADPWEHRFQVATAVLTLLQCTLMVSMAVSGSGASGTVMEWDEWLTAALALTFGIGAVVLGVRSVVFPADEKGLAPQLVVPMVSPTTTPAELEPPHDSGLFDGPLTPPARVEMTANPLARAVRR